MSEHHSSDKATRSKPPKPYPKYPLTAHTVGYWCKKIKGKTVYFGPWDDLEGVLWEYEAFRAGKPLKQCDYRLKITQPGKPAKPTPDFARGYPSG